MSGCPDTSATAADCPPLCALPSGAGNLADRLFESEKLAVLRAIASGFANEIGNPLAGVLGIMQLVARRSREPETRERLAAAHAQLTGVAQIIRELTDFTRLNGEAGVVDVNEVLRAALTLGRYAHQDASVDVALETDPRIGPLIGSRNHLLQLFLHLAMNAYEAMGGGGRLRVSSRRSDGETVVVFEDTGPGIPDGVVDHVFDPFFTTKGSTGLGLFVCRRIVVDELGGTIGVARGNEGGARFTVCLPARTTHVALPVGRPRTSR